MTKEMKIKPGYKKTPVGIIPEDWEVKRLGEFLKKIIGGGTPSRSKEEYWNGNIPWVTVKDFATFNPEKTQEYITRKGLKNSSSNLIPAKTLITATRMGLGKVSIYDIDVAINQDLKALFPKDNLHKNYLYHWFIGNEKYIESLGNGSTVKGITLDDLKGLKFYEIPIKEQKQIADCLSTWDRGIEKLAALIDAKKEQKKGLMQQLFNGQLSMANGQLEKVENEKERLKGWKEVRLGKFCDEICGEYGLNKKAIPYSKKLMRYIRITDIADDGSLLNDSKMSVALSNEEKLKYKLSEGDLLFARTGATVGKTYLYNKDSDDKMVYAGYLIRFRIDYLKAHPVFIKEFTHTQRYWNWVKTFSARSGQPGINSSEYRSLKVPIPSLQEQTAIAQVLTTADREIELLEKKLEAMKEQKKGLMQVLLTGKKRLRVKG